MGWNQDKEPGMFPVRVAWSAVHKRGLHSAGLQPNQTNKPIIQQLGSPYCLFLTLLVSKQSVDQQEHSSPFLPTLLSRPDMDIDAFAIARGRNVLQDRHAWHSITAAQGWVSLQKLWYRFPWLDFDNGSRTSLATTSCFSRMPRDSQSPALLNLRTTGMLHACWLNESNEINPSVVEI